MSIVVAAGCCCGCFYRIPLCDCENDPEPQPLYIACATLDQFFDDNPSLNGHLVFVWPCPGCSDFELCYEAEAIPANQVQVLPGNALLLLVLPPANTWFLPPFDDCGFCCPNPCCSPCWPTIFGTPPACCWRNGDTADATYHTDAFASVIECCPVGIGFMVSDCPAVDRVATYELIGCSFWVWVAGDPCMWSFWFLPCLPGLPPAGWQNSEDNVCGFEGCETSGFCPPFTPNPCVFPCTFVTGDEPGGPHPCQGVDWNLVCPFLQSRSCAGVEVCGEVSNKVTFQINATCQFVPIGPGNFPDGSCFPLP